MNRKMDGSTLMLPIKEADTSPVKGRVRPFIYRVDVPWVQAVLKLGFQAARMAFVIHQSANLSRVRHGTEKFFKLRPKLYRQYGLDRAAASRGLRKLEKAGLVVVQRQKGAAPMVKVVLPALD